VQRTKQDLPGIIVGATRDGEGGGGVDAAHMQPMSANGEDFGASILAAAPALHCIAFLPKSPTPAYMPRRMLVALDGSALGGELRLKN
jgi:hypothetical protein